MAKKPEKDTFLDDAEKVIREFAAKNPNLQVYRGKFPHKEVGETVLDYDTIIVGMSDDKDATKPPSLVVMKVWVDYLGGKGLDFSVGSDDDSYRFVPSSLDALPDVRELAERLPHI